MDKRKIAAYAMLPVIGLGVFGGASLASAHGWGGWGFFNKTTPEEIATHQNEMFQSQADLLGASVDEVKSAWAQGKTLREIAQEKGITDEQLAQKMKDAHLVQLKTNLQVLVDRGVISQAQADQRYETMKTRMESSQGKMKMFRGRHMMM